MDGQNNKQRENRSPFILLKVQAPFRMYEVCMPILSSYFLHYPSLLNLLRLITKVKSSLPSVVFVTGRGGEGFHSPDPALTRGLGGMFRVIPALPPSGATRTHSLDGAQFVTTHF